MKAAPLLRTNAAKSEHEQKHVVASFTTIENHKKQVGRKSKSIQNNRRRIRCMWPAPERGVWSGRAG